MLGGDNPYQPACTQAWLYQGSFMYHPCMELPWCDLPCGISDHLLLSLWLLSCSLTHQELGIMQHHVWPECLYMLQGGGVQEQGQAAGCEPAWSEANRRH
jgi:hypothetical protein